MVYFFGLPNGALFDASGASARPIAGYSAARAVGHGSLGRPEIEVTLPDAIKWSGWINGFPLHSGEMATLYGGLDKPVP
jgi:hypothetical protein